jgi:hypothetical protein
MPSIMLQTSHRLIPIRGLADSLGIEPATTPRAHTVLRLAQTRTEVPPTEMQAAAPAPDFANSEPPLWDGLGSITYKISSSSAEAQAYFDQGLRLAYAFNHGEAQRAFRKAQKLDPSCAMCFWGEALVLGPNINLPMQEDAVGQAFTAAQVALQCEPTRAGTDRCVGHYSAIRSSVCGTFMPCGSRDPPATVVRARFRARSAG